MVLRAAVLAVLSQRSRVSAIDKILNEGQGSVLKCADVSCAACAVSEDYLPARSMLVEASTEFGVRSVCRVKNGSWSYRENIRLDLYP